MQFYDVVKNRTSIKKFKSTPIDRISIERMINAALIAPSWKNEVSYKFILVEDNNEKKLLSQCIMNDTNEVSKAIVDAPLVAIVVGDPSASGVVDNKEYYLVDSAIAMEHFILAATAEGLGTCWVGAFDERKVKEILQVPGKYKVVAMTPVGEIDEVKNHSYEKRDSNYVFRNNWNESYDAVIK